VRKKAGGSALIVGPEWRKERTPVVKEDWTKAWGGFYEGDREPVRFSILSNRPAKIEKKSVVHVHLQKKEPVRGY